MVISGPKDLYQLMNELRKPSPTHSSHHLSLAVSSHSPSKALRDDGPEGVEVHSSRPALVRLVDHLLQLLIRNHMVPNVVGDAPQVLGRDEVGPIRSKRLSEPLPNLLLRWPLKQLVEHDLDERVETHLPRALSLIHISEPTRLLSISYAVFCLKKKKNKIKYNIDLL
eukprot:TRINITY_DN1244_c0_g1_i2.p1 TRINITY_DN1244_c0_g1~~TRINITY_DN1244_c0_g1_i2.p1  ORF type:complete len:168 (+),score=20.62 TRINITY_DN1244_c0_g1_i2:171-674(+)